MLRYAEENDLVHSDCAKNRWVGNVAVKGLNSVEKTGLAGANTWVLQGMMNEMNMIPIAALSASIPVEKIRESLS